MANLYLSKTNRIQRIISQSTSLSIVVKKSLWVVPCLMFLGFMACSGPEYPRCDTNNNCRKGEFCVNGQCQECRISYDCPKGKECIVGSCEPIEDYCITSDQCEANEECNDHRCVEAKISATPRKYEQTINTGQKCQLTPIYFAFDSSDLKQVSRDRLARDAKCIQKDNMERLNLTGYCDPRGTEEYNLALGFRRANSTREYLSALGVGANMNPLSMGEEMASGTDEQSWALDRRVEIRTR